ncbi:MAG: urate oxidase [Actinomycetes bacterium]|jgi:urate oxidase|nr:MAG: urate oxidase [Actinomycetota bacterium]
MPLGAHSWGKSRVRVSRILRGDPADEILDLNVDIQLTATDVDVAHTEGDNRGVYATDTMRNTVYALAHEHLGPDLEGFAGTLCDHFLSVREEIVGSDVTITANRWDRRTDRGFVGGSSEKRIARVVKGEDTSLSAGIEGLVVLKTGGSAFEGFPRDRFTTLPEAADRILATSVTAHWDYATKPEDTTATWERVRETMLGSFFGEWSASVQHQGYLMGEAVLAAVPEVSRITFRLPNQHHLPFDVTRFGVEDTGTVFYPVPEPFGDIRLTVGR